MACSIEVEELIHMCHTLGSSMTDAEVEAIFNAADKDGSKKLRKDELYRLFANGKFQVCWGWCGVVWCGDVR